MACVHGNPSGSCSICRTLAEIDKLSPVAPTRDRGGRRRSGRTPVAVTVTEVAATASGRRRFGTHAALFVVVLVIAAASVWIVSGILFAFIRLIEIVAVAGVAGTLGYRLGHHRGRQGR